MARVPVVSRTIVSTKANVLFVNTTNGETENKDVIVPRTYKDNEKLLKAIVKTMDENTIYKPVHVVSSEVVKNRYVMNESDFIKYATISQ